MTEKGPIKMLAWVLLLVGGLNWGLVGIGGFMGKNLNLVNMLLGSWPTVEWIVYILVGVSAVCCMMCCGKCKSEAGGGGGGAAM